MQNNRAGILFEGGFRVFFLGAAIYAALTMAIWSLQMSGSFEILERIIEIPLPAWHAHELIFGFIVAVVAGFLTTAVPVWANTPRIRGGQLITLFTLWLAGRLAMDFSAYIPLQLTAIIDLLFIPALALTIAIPIIQKKLWKNLGFIPLLLLLMGGNALIHMELIGWRSDTAEIGIRLSIGLLVLMTIIIGGRVIPFFTQNWLKRHGKQVVVTAPSWITKVVILSSVITVFANSLLNDEFLLTALNTLTGVFILLRLSYWKGFSTIKDPVMFILHVGYALIGLSFLANAAAISTEFFPEILAQHVFTIGGLGVMILGMMSRIALGHTGRPLEIHWLTSVSYVFILLALASRIIPMLYLPEFYSIGLTVAGSSWIIAWILHLTIYMPILLSPRPDGKEG